MAKKDKVKEQYPDATAQKYTTKGFFARSYWLIWNTWKSTGRERLGEGDTQAQAWADALDNFLGRP